MQPLPLRLLSKHQRRGCTDHFALCGNANQQIGNGCLSTQFRSAYRVDGSTPTARCEYLGADQAAAPAATVTAIDGGIAIGYNGGQTGTALRTMTVNLLCDTPYLDAPSPGVLGGDNPELNWPTQAVCPAGGNTGWLIVILFSVAAGIYVGGGIGYVKRQDPDVPLMEAHPHTEMWRTVPGLFWDGVYFTRVELSSRFEFLGFLAPAVRTAAAPTDRPRGFESESSFSVLRRMLAATQTSQMTMTMARRSHSLPPAPPPPQSPSPSPSPSR